MATAQTDAAAEARRRARVQALATELCREHRARLLSIARANGAGRADANDAVQFAFLAFLEKFDPDSGAPPLAWLTLTLKRSCWAEYRRQRLDRSAGQEAAPGSGEPGFSAASLASQAPGAEEAIERSEWLLDARRRLAALKPDQRRALGLLGAGFSYREIGEITGFSHTKTNRSIAEGRATLRADLAS